MVFLRVVADRSSADVLTVLGAPTRGPGCGVTSVRAETSRRLGTRVTGGRDAVPAIIADVGRPRIRWGLLSAGGVALCLACVVGAVVCQILRLGAGGGWDLVSATAPLGAVMAGCAAVVLSRRPGHRIGYVLLGFGVLWAVDGLLEAWYGLGITPPYGTAPDDVLPGTTFAYWFVARVGAFLLMGLPLILLLYPTGRLLAGRWRILGRVTIGATALLPVALLIMPAGVLELGMATPPIDDPDLLSAPIPATVGFPVLVVTRLITFAAVLPALVLVVSGTGARPGSSGGS